MNYFMHGGVIDIDLWSSRSWWRVETVIRHKVADVAVAYSLADA